MKGVRQSSQGQYDGAHDSHQLTVYHLYYQSFMQVLRGISARATRYEPYDRDNRVRFPIIRGRAFREYFMRKRERADAPPRPRRPHEKFNAPHETKAGGSRAALP
ncbi:hypothetical protein EVAR_30314_1 [Eumeta japonica]|uniref:Uncharacterized protein n=1 Tax=Eumeta variegata TaxID=151549 RepID=A0A4C1W9Q0_EUMVA|nr:hypothetical protein EVAR_30314_1 [Eumeta japonica]